MINPLHLRTLAMVLRAGSFAEAGRRLGYSGSAVSQQMASLEGDTGLVLFDRGAHDVRPTVAAFQVAARAAETLGALASLERAVGEMAAGTRGRLGLGSFPTASEVFVAGALARFQRKLPDVEVVFVDGEPSDLVPGLLTGDLDVVVSFRYDGVPQVWPPAVQRTELVIEPVALLVPQRPPLEAQSGAPVALSDFSSVPWIATQEGTAGTRAVERACADAGFVPPVRYRTNDYDVVRSFVRAGLGVAAVPWLAHAGRADLSVVQPTGLAVRRRVEALTVRRPPSPAVAAMVSELRTAAAALSPPLPATAWEQGKRPRA